MAQQVSTNTFGVAKWVVSSDATQGTHTTIAGALTSASSGDTIFIRPGTYTENPTLKAGVNLAAFDADSETPNVTIVGKCTATFAGTASLCGLQLQTNSDFALAVTGSSATVVNLFSCSLQGQNNTIISYTSSSSSSAINLYSCISDFATTGIALFSSSGAGNVQFNNHIGQNTGGTTTATSFSSGNLKIQQSIFKSPFTLTGGGLNAMVNSQIDTAAINTAALTTTTGGSFFIYNSHFAAGTASAISIGTSTTANIYNSSIASSNTNAITGAGTLNYSGLIFTSTSVKINTTTQTGGVAQGGVTQAPSTGFIGEAIRSQVNNTGISTGTPTNLTSISLTAGIWDVSCLAQFTSGGVAGTKFQAGISTTSATFGTQGDSQVTNDFAANTVNNLGVAIPSFRITLTATTTTYLVVQSNFGGTMQVAGRISATRVG